MAQRVRAATALLATVAASAAALYGLRWLAADVISAARQPVEPDVVLLAAVEVALLLTLARCVLAGLLSVAALAGRRRGHVVGGLALRASPRVVRPLVAAALAAGLAVAAGPASAATRSPSLPTAGWTAAQTPSVSGPSSPDGLRLPVAGWVPTQAPADRPGSVAEVSAVSAAPRRHLDVDRTVVVRRGDCLWSVVARSLGPHAGDARVAEQWPRWWAANRAVIGDDPALLLPGTRLHPPTSPVAAR